MLRPAKALLNNHLRAAAESKQSAAEGSASAADASASSSARRLSGCGEGKNQEKERRKARLSGCGEGSTTARCSVYLLSWYKSTNTDAAHPLLAARVQQLSDRCRERRCSLFLLYWYKSTDTDAARTSGEWV